MSQVFKDSFGKRKKFQSHFNLLGNEKENKGENKEDIPLKKKLVDNFTESNNSSSKKQMHKLFQ